MTYSVVARDTKTGQLGVAVQTHWFGVGNNVPWLEAGVGAIATQAQTNQDYGKKGLKLLEKGVSVEDTFYDIAATDDAVESRQVAMIDNSGNMFAYTGKDSVQYAGYLVGDNFIVQGNILSNETVLPAMKQAYEENIEDDFGLRLYKTIQAGEKAGGELRGVQSSALRIVPGNLGGYDILNLRIDDHLTPLVEMERQLKIQQAYNFLNAAQEEGIKGNVQKSKELFQEAHKILPENKEFLFWEMYMLKNNGYTDEADEIFNAYFRDEEMWKEFKKRI